MSQCLSSQSKAGCSQEGRRVGVLLTSRGKCIRQTVTVRLHGSEEMAVAYLEDADLMKTSVATVRLVM